MRRVVASGRTLSVNIWRAFVRSLVRHFWLRRRPRRAVWTLRVRAARTLPKAKPKSWSPRFYAVSRRGQPGLVCWLETADGAPIESARVEWKEVRDDRQR